MFKAMMFYRPGSIRALLPYITSQPIQVWEGSAAAKELELRQAERGAEINHEEKEKFSYFVQSLLAEYVYFKDEMERFMDSARKTDKKKSAQGITPGRRIEVKRTEKALYELHHQIITLHLKQLRDHPEQLADFERYRSYSTVERDPIPTPIACTR